MCVRLLGYQRARIVGVIAGPTSGGCTVGEKAPIPCLALVLISPRDLTKSPYRSITRCQKAPGEHWEESYAPSSGLSRSYVGDIAEQRG